MNQIILRPDQYQLKSDVINGWNQGHRNVMAQLSTGGGKSVIMSDIVLDMHRSGASQIVMAHRSELVSQMSVHIARRGIEHKIVAPQPIIKQVIREHRAEFNGRSYVNHNSICAVGGVDTILSREQELSNWAKQQAHWYIDEAHHVLRQNKWGKCVSMFTNARGLGVTATPERADGEGLGVHVDGVFNVLYTGPSMRELIEMGALSDFEIVVPTSDFEVPNQVTATGDYSLKKMREASRKSHIVGDVVLNYMRYAFGKRAIVFATDVETAGKIAQNFNDHGILCASVSAKTPPDTRAEYVRRFREGRLTVLVNVDLFGEGFDVPAVEVVIMARPTASLAVFLQQFGRALRVMPGKQFGLVIDHVSNWKRHGFPDKPRRWTLDRRDKRAKSPPDPNNVEPTVCQNCARAYEKALLCCPHCGHVNEPPSNARSSIEQVDGDLMLLDREAIKKLRESIELPSPASVGSRAQFVAGDVAGRAAANRQIEKIQSQKKLVDAIELWAGYQRAMNRSDRESYKRFYLTTGVDVLTALTQTRAEMDVMTELVHSWIGSIQLQGVA